MTQNAVRTQAERSALSDARMLDAAVELLVAHGTSGTTLKALGESSGYSRGLVTYRFGTKGGLFAYVIESVSSRWLLELERSVIGRDGLEAIEIAAETYYQFVLDCPKHIRAMQILIYEAASPGSELGDAVQTLYGRQRHQIAAWVRSGQLAGRIDASVAPDDWAVRFLAHMVGMTHLWMVRQPDIDWPGIHNQFKQQIHEQLATRADNHTEEEKS
jgi:AcrR family transcriptional regulator